MLDLKLTTQFKKDYKKARKRGLDIGILDKVLLRLQENEKLEEKYRDHALVGRYAGLRECHLLPNWLLIYEINQDA